MGKLQRVQSALWAGLTVLSRCCRLVVTLHVTAKRKSVKPGHADEILFEMLLLNVLFLASNVFRNIFKVYDPSAMLKMNDEKQTPPNSKNVTHLVGLSLVWCIQTH